MQRIKLIVKRKFGVERGMNDWPMAEWSVAWEELTLGGKEKLPVIIAVSCTVLLFRRLV